MKILEERDFENVPSIAEYFAGKTIFITGGSGFMGKVLIEKLLYTCDRLEKIYILLRTKKGVPFEERVTQIFSSKCFDRLRKEKPNIFKAKVSAVSGDIMEPGLGLSAEDRALLVDRVHIIFHIAASTRLDDSLSVALKANLRSTKDALAIAKEAKNITCFVQVSSAYSIVPAKHVEEIMYPPYVSWRDTLEVCEKTDEYTLLALSAKYLGEHPNTYTLAKHLGDQMVYEHRDQVPVVIFRPSVVISSISEPCPGWFENFGGIAGLMAVCGKGVMRSALVSPDLYLDCVSVDIAIKSLIAAAWVRGTKELSADDTVPIYNCCFGELQKITMHKAMDIFKKVNPILPMSQTLWNPNCTLTTSKTIHYINILLFHLLPAVFVDCFLRIIGKQPMLLKVQQRIFRGNLACEYFLKKQWTFSHSNLMRLRSTIKPQDQKEFYFDIESLNIEDYLYTCIAGGRKYLFGERDEDIPKARAHYRRMLWLDRIMKCIFYGLLCYWLISSNVIGKIITFIS